MTTIIHKQIINNYFDSECESEKELPYLRPANQIPYYAECSDAFNLKKKNEELQKERDELRMELNQNVQIKKERDEYKNLYDTIIASVKSGKPLHFAINPLNNKLVSKNSNDSNEDSFIYKCGTS